MKKLLLIIALGAILFGFESGYAPHISVTGNKDDAIVLKNKGFDIDYNLEKKRPNFVLYNITRERLEKPKVKKYFNFKGDKRIPKEYRIYNSAYKGTGYDRGHNAENGSFNRDTVSKEQTYLLSNVTPQTPHFNRITWRAIEQKSRDLAKQYEKVEILTGSCGNKNQMNGVTVPEYWYKVIYVSKLGESLVYLVPNQDYFGINKDKPIESFKIWDFISSIDEINNKCKLKIIISK